MEINRKKLFTILFRDLLSLSLAALFIGFLHKKDLIIAAVLLFCLLFFMYKKFQSPSNEKWIYLSGALVAATLGVVCEKWGIYNNYWQYHGLENSRQFPYWLPFAWACTFIFMYRIEKKIIISQKIKTLSSKLLLAVAISVVFPTVGEMITVNLGVWTYYWDYQILGIPLLAIFFLTIFHTGIYLLFSFVCKKKNIHNEVFNAAP